LHYCNSELSGVAPVPDIGLVGGVDPGGAARDEGQDNGPGPEELEKTLPRPTSQREANKSRRDHKDVAAGVVVFPGLDQAGDQPQGGLLLDAQG
jgi:hypothetical protein